MGLGVGVLTGGGVGVGRGVEAGVGVLVGAGVLGVGVLTGVASAVGVGSSPPQAVNATMAINTRIMDVMRLVLFNSVSLPTTSARMEPRLRLPWCQSYCVSSRDGYPTSARLEEKLGAVPGRSALHKSYLAKGEGSKAIASDSQTER